LEKETMQPKSNAAAEVGAYYDSREYGHANRIVDLALQRLPSGEFAYLEPPNDEPRFTITDAGRRALRMADLSDSNR
jgi:hypothetical protein